MAVKASKQISERLKLMLTRDKMGVGEGFLAALTSDLNRLLGDYFTLDGDIRIDVQLGDDGRYSVDISAEATNVKKFESTGFFKTPR